MNIFFIMFFICLALYLILNNPRLPNWPTFKYNLLYGNYYRRFMEMRGAWVLSVFEPNLDINPFPDTKIRIKSVCFRRKTAIKRMEKLVHLYLMPCRCSPACYTKWQPDYKNKFLLWDRAYIYDGPDCHRPYSAKVVILIEKVKIFGDRI